MAYPRIKLADNSGNEVGVTDNRLNVNAYLSATPTIDIGDVSLLLGGTAASVNNGAADATTLRVTIASDTTGVLSVDDNGSTLSIDDGGGTITVDGTVTANLSATDNAVLDVIAADTTEIAGRFITPGVEWVQQRGIAVLAVRNDVLEPLFGTADNDHGNLQVDSVGGLYVTGSEVENAAVQSEPLLIGGRFDSSARTLGDGDAGAVALNASGHVLMDVVDGGQLDALLDTIKVDTEAIETAVELLDNAIDGSEMQVDIVAALPAGSNTIGVVDLGSTDNAVLDAMVVDLAAMEALLITIDSDTDAIKTAVQILDDWDDSNYANVTINLAGSDAPTGGGAESGALRVTLANDSTGVISIDDGGNTITVDGTVTANLGTTDNAVLDAIAASLALLDNSIASGSELQVDVVAALPAGTNAIGKLGHDITGLSSDDNDTVGTSAEKISGADGDVACKRIDIMAHPSNTGEIWVGDSAITTNGANGGIRLLAGDFYSMDIDNTADVYVIATVDGENVCFNYFT